MRFADFFVHPGRDEIWGIREILTGPAPTDVRRDIVAVPLDGSAAGDAERIRVLGAGQRFLASLRLSPDGTRLAWIGWDHPSMPWDQTTLWLAEVLGGAVGTPCRLAGGHGERENGPGNDGAGKNRPGKNGEAIAQAEWLSDRSIAYVSDVGGWWNLYRTDVPDRGEGGDLAGSRPVSICPREEEFGDAIWQLGRQWFVPLAGGPVAAIHGRDSTRLSLLDPWRPGDPDDGATPCTGTALRTFSAPYTEWAPCLAARGSQVAAVAASPHRPYEVVLADTETGVVTTLAPAPAGCVDPAFLPLPCARTFRGPGGRDVHATLYPPRNPGFAGPPGEPPPYVVFVHGGPTSRCRTVYDLEIAYFTSRGLGVVEVDYGGSTGYGRAYRERLRENWGVVDVDDCAAVATALAAEGTAHERRLAIRGGSAGGWTTAVSLIRTGVYQGGIIYYPILDLAGWRTGETHDFESQYLDSLVGPWPQASEVYHERSPVNHAGELAVPFLLLQGLEDAICPPAQCERFLARVAQSGMPHAYLTFEGEQHGFRKAETIAAALEAELSFLGQTLGFTPADIPPVNLTRGAVRGAVQK
jgi:dipeptidyl aminopeptidase/acylaminoacyl peptidase